VSRDTRWIKHYDNQHHANIALFMTFALLKCVKASFSRTARSIAYDYDYDTTRHDSGRGAVDWKSRRLVQLSVAHVTEITRKLS